MFPSIKLKERVKRRQHFCEVISKVALKYGCMGNASRNFKEEYIREFWDYKNYGNYPTYTAFRLSKDISVGNIKWYIHNKIKIDDKIWNGDFIHGLASYGNIKWNKTQFPTLQWLWNDRVIEVLEKSQFGGRLSTCKYDKKYVYRWNNVPALYLPFSTESISFIAGVMAGAMNFNYNGNDYAKISYRLEKIIKQYGIPIEYTVKSKRWLLISSIWPALFVNYMPHEIGEKWINLRSPFNASIYSTILWKTYIGNNFTNKKLPYLLSRRSIFYNFKSEEGTMKNVDLLRVKHGLTMLHDNIKIAVQEWNQNR